MGQGESVEQGLWIQVSGLHSSCAKAASLAVIDILSSSVKLFHCYTHQGAIIKPHRTHDVEIIQITMYIYEHMVNYQVKHFLASLRSM